MLYSYSIHVSFAQPWQAAGHFKFLVLDYKDLRPKATGDVFNKSGKSSRKEGAYCLQ